MSQEKDLSVSNTLKNKIMDDNVQKFLTRLKTIKNKACDERVTVKTVHDRAKKGIYKMIDIDGCKFIVEPKKD